MEPSITLTRSSETELTASCANWRDLDEGAQVKVCHQSCPAGEDTRYRMYITKKHGVWLWYCHNCSNGGHVRDREHFTNLMDKPKFDTHSGMTVRYDKDDLRKMWDAFDTNIEKFPPTARIWLAEYEMLKIAESCDIRWDSFSNRLALPIKSISGSFEGWQARRFGTLSPADMGPKYMTFVNDEYKGKPGYYSPTMWHRERMVDNIFIVEDILSAMKIAYCGADAVALLGTAAETRIAGFNLTRQMVVWLDKDVAGQRAAINMVRELSAVHPGLHSISLDQPKEIPYAELCGIIGV